MYKFTFCILNCSSCWTQLKVLKLATRIKHSAAALHTFLAFAIWRWKPMQTQHKMQIASTTYSRRRRCIWECNRHTTFFSLSLSILSLGCIVSPVLPCFMVHWRDILFSNWIPDCAVSVVPVDRCSQNAFYFIFKFSSLYKYSCIFFDWMV